MGLAWLLSKITYAPEGPFAEPWERHAHTIFFLGIALTCFGSGYYHLWPSNSTLFWDRLPMTLAFMALFAVVIGDRLRPSWGKLILFPSVILGVMSVVYWYSANKPATEICEPTCWCNSFHWPPSQSFWLSFRGRYNRTAVTR